MEADSFDEADFFRAIEQSGARAEHVRFEDIYSRALVIRVAGGASIRVPTVSDLILTKRFAVRAKDIADIRLLESHAARRERS
jgi:hypothetical protein